MELISQKLIDALNYRIEQEEYSSRLYKAMSVCMGYKGYLGAEALFAKYSKEEEAHAEWAYKFLLSLDIRPVVPALKAPPEMFEGLPEVLRLAFEHEKLVTKQCEELATLAFSEKSFMTLELAQKYLKEQVEEIEKTTTLLDQLDAFGTSDVALRLLDNHLKEIA